MTSKLQQELRDDDPLAALAAMSGVKDRQQVSADDDGEVERRTVTLDDFTIDPEIQVRLGGPDLEYAEELSQILINGGRYRDPIVLFRDEDGQRWLADGFNRCDGLVIAQRAVPELQELDAEIHPGGRDAAIEYAETANLQHGKVLTMEERRSILERRLKRGHAWATMSARA
ncbi:MAG TPA: hypothetical protein PKA36_11945, partial [Pseudoxanthomonas mexicana]|nr:hypothetical protein [Pseudoxanthomonas mexicana]